MLTEFRGFPTSLMVAWTKREWFKAVISTRPHLIPLLTIHIYMKTFSDRQFDAEFSHNLLFIHPISEFINNIYYILFNIYWCPRFSQLNYETNNHLNECEGSLRVCLCVWSCNEKTHWPAPNHPHMGIGHHTFMFIFIIVFTILYFFFPGKIHHHHQTFS